ncbi:MAG: hypothetical protein ACOYBP_04340 [Microbacteriaceae bacterium]
MFRRISSAAAAIAIATGVVLAAVSPASAVDGYVPPGGITWVNSNDGSLIVNQGGATTFQIGDNSFTPDQDVDYTLSGEAAGGATLASVRTAITSVDLGTRPANGQGGYTGHITMPANGGGSYTLTATQGGTVLTAEIVVVSGMATTGVNSGLMQIGLWGGAALVVFGAILLALLYARRRKSSQNV